MTAGSQARVVSVGPYELWFVAHLTMGVAYLGGGLFVLPAFALSLPGATPGDVGIVMAMRSVRLSLAVCLSGMARTEPSRSADSGYSCSPWSCSLS